MYSLTGRGGKNTVSSASIILDPNDEPLVRKLFPYSGNFRGVNGLQAKARLLVLGHGKTQRII